MAENNVQTTIGSPIEWYKLEVMRDVINVKEAWESYSKNDSLGMPVELGVVQARTQSLFNALYPYLKRKLKGKVKDGTEFDFMKIQLFDSGVLNKDVLRQIFWDITTQLDKDNITKMDTRTAYDGTRAEEENKVFGL